MLLQLMTIAARLRSHEGMTPVAKQEAPIACAWIRPCSFIFPKSATTVFAYKSKEKFLGNDGHPIDGWAIYDARAEYERIGVQRLPCKSWSVLAGLY